MENGHIPTFNDLTFTNHPLGDGFRAELIMPNNYAISVVCGKYYYCQPKETLNSADIYETYEVAVLDPEGEFCTGEFTHESQQEIAGWQTQDDISDIMTRVFLRDKLNRML